MYAAQSALTVFPSDMEFNEETAPDNPFVLRDCGMTLDEIRKRAGDEFMNMVRLVSEVGIKVHVYDRRDYKELNHLSWPDAVYPNWWLTDTNGRVWFMPMCCRSRNSEKALAPFVIEDLRKQYRISGITNFGADSDPSKMSLEGIGAMCVDRYKRRVYSNRSRRSNLTLLRKWAADAGYEPVRFETMGRSGEPFYHTDLMLAVGDKFAVVCAESIVPKHRDRVLGLLAEDRELIEITLDQAEDHYCANIIQMRNDKDETFVIMSEAAYEGFTQDQRDRLSQYGKLIVCPMPTIEMVGGGSLHCVLQEIFMAPKEE